MFISHNKNRYIPSKADISVFDTLGKFPTGDYAHVQRFYRHIASFSNDEKSKWGGQALPQAIGGKPTIDSKSSKPGTHEK